MRGFNRHSLKRVLVRAVIVPEQFIAYGTCPVFGVAVLGASGILGIDLGQSMIRIIPVFVFTYSTNRFRLAGSFTTCTGMR